MVKNGLKTIIHQEVDRQRELKKNKSNNNANRQL